MKYFFEADIRQHWERPFVCTDEKGDFQSFYEIGKSYSDAVSSCKRISNFEVNF